MGQRALRLIFVVGVGALLGGCCFVAPLKSFDFQLNTAVFIEGIPQPAGEAILSAEQLTSYPELKIDPESAVGYDQLPEELKHLYGPSPMPIGQADVVHQMLMHNRDIKIQGYTLQIAGFLVPITKSIYDLFIHATGEFTKSKSQNQQEPFELDLGALAAAAPAPAGPMGADPAAAIDPALLLGGFDFAEFFGLDAETLLSRRRELSVDVTQLLPTGAILQLAYTFSRDFADPNFNRIVPLYRHVLMLTLVQPLLRGLGPKVTNADIHIAQLGYEASAAEFETQVAAQIRQALLLYWDLVFAVQSYAVRLISMTAGLDLLRNNEVRYEVGQIARTQVLQARANVDLWHEQVLLAEQRVRETEDVLKLMMFFGEGEPNWELELDPIQELSWREIEVDVQSVFDEALGNRPEVRARRSLIDRSDQEIVKALDARKPQLDLTGSAGISGIDSGGAQAFNWFQTADFNNFVLALEFSFPFQNRQARYELSQRHAERLQAEEGYHQTVDGVTAEVRAAIRALNSARERIETSRTRVQSEQANVNDEWTMYREGLSTLFEVLDFQEDLANAQEANIQAIVDYNKAFISLEYARGTLLQSYGVLFEPSRFQPGNPPVGFPVGFH